MPFLTGDIKVSTSNGHRFVVTEPFIYRTNSGEEITVPAGSLTDGASVPRIFWRIFPPFGKYWRAAVLHDFMYRYSDFRKKKCDKIFYEAMRSVGVGFFRAKIIYLSVKFGGGLAFRNARKNRNQ